MPRISAKITGVARYLPPRLLTNEDLERMVDTNHEWIFERTGISERHIVDKGVAASHLATEAARQLLQQKQVAPEDIDLIIVATVTPDILFPSTACLVQNNLGCRRAWGFDLIAACSGFVYAVTVGAQFVAAGTHRRALVIGSDVMTSIIDFEDRATCILFGDGAGAVLLEPTADGEEGILDFHHDIDKKMHYVHQDGRQVFKYAVRRMGEVAELLLTRNSFQTTDLKLLVPHQANQRIIRATQQRLGLPDERVLLNIGKFGNTTAGTIPIALVDALACGRLKKGDLTMLLAVGAGFTTGGLLLRWAY